MMTLFDILDAGGVPAGHGVKIRTATGKWSKPYVYAGQMYRDRGHNTFVSMDPLGGVWIGNKVTGRRYLDPDTEACIVRLP